MGLSKDVMGGGFSAGQAAALNGNYVSIAATGSTITDAAPITASMVVITAADGTKGVKLVGNVGDSMFVANSSASTLKVYPGSASESIWVPGTSAGTGGTAYSQTLWAVCEYIKVTSTQWLVQKSA